jgi:hypothetical protein
MTFKRYPHLVKYGNREVLGLDIGDVYIFPKLDGSNGSIWYDGRIRCGSRNRELDTLNPGNQDNQGFAKYIYTELKEKLEAYFKEHPNHVLYGEWLVPHTIKNYRDGPYNKFYIFDVYDGHLNNYHHYDVYKHDLDRFSLDYVPCTHIISCPKEEQLRYCAANSNYLLDSGTGEGVVLKNYTWINVGDNDTWAKIVNNEFKDSHISVMGPSILEVGSNEKIICNRACTEHLIKKEYAKLVSEGWHQSKIPKLLHTVYYCVVTEELWDCLRHLKDRTIDFKYLERLCKQKVKEILTEVF